MSSLRQPAEAPASARDFTALKHGLMIVVVTALLCIPCLRVGIPPGFDSEYHTAYQYHVSRQFWEGDLYPRWLAAANKGNGSPIFLVQYPLPYLLTALLRPITSFSPGPAREARELGVFCFLVLAGAALAARAWFRHRCAPWAATFAAIAYVLLPYIFGQALYRRSALGELCSFVWMPLALALCEPFPGFAVVSGLGVVFGLLLLSNGLSAAVFLPLMVTYALVSWTSSHVPPRRCATWLLLALALGVGTAAVYLVPLVAYRSLFDLKVMTVLHPGFELGRWFLYATSSSLTSNHAVSRGLAVPVIASIVCLTTVVAVYVWRRGSLVSRVSLTLPLVLGVALLTPDLGPALVGASGLMVSAFETPADFALTMLLTALSTLALGVLSYCRLATRATPRDRLLLVAAWGAFMMMVPWSAIVWASIPQLAILQFPFRLGAILTVAVAGLFAGALDDGLRHRAHQDERPSLLALASAAGVVIGAGLLSWGVAGRFRVSATADRAVARNVDVMFRSYVSRERLPALAKRIGATVDSFSVVSTPLDDAVRADFTRGHGTASVTRLRPRRLRVSAVCDADARVRISQVYFPLWRVVPVAPSSDLPLMGVSEEGLIELSLPPGRHDFELRFDVGWPERAGAIVTLASILVAVGGSLAAAQKRAFRQ